jgi:alginate O-acetyltransferase complex protein AlgI
MLFTSSTFVIFFGIVFTLYLLARRFSTLRVQNVILALSSLVFYSWWDWRFLGLLLFSCASNYVTALHLEKAASLFRKKAWLVTSITIQLGILAVFKYLGFGIENLNACLRGLGFESGIPAVSLVLPVGISFYTFQAIGYTVDVYRGKTRPCRHPVDFVLFVSFFPQLVAGPIETSKNLIPQIESPRSILRESFTLGLYWILVGLFKKVVIADTLAPMVDYSFSNVGTVSGISSLLGIIAFSLQIYGDFAGYTYIARGVAKWMGFDLTINFRRPYLAESPVEFWRRWHISLSHWLRDYLYISLGGNRRGLPRTCFNLMTTMVLGGLWHGAAWNFVMWGAYHGTLLCINHLMVFYKVPFRLLPERLRLGNKVLRVAGMFMLTLFGWLLFRASSVAQANGILRNIFTNFQWSAEVPAYLLPVCTLSALLFSLHLIQEKHDDELIVLKWPPVVRWSLYVFIAATVAVVGFSTTPFIYFQF